MSKVTSKRQVTVPKEIADRFRIQAGDEIEWVPAGEEIRVLLPGRSSPPSLTTEERLRLFDQATSRRNRRQGTVAGHGEAKDRAWTREELYRRGRAG